MKATNLGNIGFIFARVDIEGIPIQRSWSEEAIRIVNRALDMEINFIDASRTPTDYQMLVSSSPEYFSFV